jgi:predicted PurR-regulated permease PerM
MGSASGLPPSDPRLPPSDPQPPAISGANAPEPARVHSNRPGIDQPFRDSLRVLGLYVKAQFLIGLVMTVLYAIGFGIARVPLWPVVAILGGLTSLIPRIGSLIPLGLAALTITWTDQNWTHLLIAFGAWVVIQVLQGFWITPRFLSKPLGLRPLPVFVALLAGSMFFGPLGLLLAVPVLAIAAIFWRYFRNS